MEVISKRYQIFFAYALFTIYTIFGHTTTYTQINSNAQAVDQPELINRIFERELHNLDLLGSNIQYIGQAIQKKIIQVTDKEKVFAWLVQQQQVMRSLTKLANQIADNLIELDYLVHANFLLAQTIMTALTSNFTTLPYFELPPKPIIKRSSDSPSLLADIEQVQYKSNALMIHLQAEIEHAGLTTINKVARYLDSLNDQYHFTTAIDYLPIATVISSALFFYTPPHWVDKLQLPRLSRLKQQFGTATPIKSYFEQPNQTESSSNKPAPEQEKPHIDKPIGEKLEDFLADPKMQATAAFFSSVGYWALNETKHMNPILKLSQAVMAPLKQAVRTRWQQLKGYSLPRQSLYTIYEDITLDDERLIGLDSQIEQLRNLVRYLVSPELYDRSNASLEKGIMLVGPSRCGKTFAAKALAGSINQALKNQRKNTRFSFREIKWSDIAYYYENGIKDLIEEARNSAPCVLFIDEIHNMPLQAKDHGGRIISNFLTGMSGVNTENDANNQIILMAATNQAEKLDTALLQPGRFGSIIHFEKPHYENRKKYFDIHFAYNLIDTEHIDIDSLARQTQGCSYGCLEAIIKHGRFVGRKQATPVTQAYLQEKINSLVYRIKDEIPHSAHERQAVTVHMAGHALTSILLDTDSHPLNKHLELVTIKGRWHKIIEKRMWETAAKDTYDQQISTFGGLFRFEPSEILHAATKEQLIKECKIKLAGAIAEELLLETASITFHPNDQQKAFAIIKQVIFAGLENSMLPKKQNEIMLHQAYTLFEQCKREVKQLLTDHIANLLSVTKALEQHHTLTAQEIKDLLC